MAPQVSSPMAGTFYRSPAPGEPAFVKEGDRVEKGQTVGIIEAMKLMNEIEVRRSCVKLCGVLHPGRGVCLAEQPGDNVGLAVVEISLDAPEIPFGGRGP